MAADCDRFAFEHQDFFSDLWSGAWCRRCDDRVHLTKSGKHLVAIPTRNSRCGEEGDGQHYGCHNRSRIAGSKSPARRRSRSR